jgi:hypothetical protein
MRIYSKRIRVLGLTKDEISMLMDMVTEAQKGTLVNYSERQTAPGEYFGISVSPDNKQVIPERGSVPYKH